MSFIFSLPTGQATRAALVTLQVIMIIAAPWLLILQEPTIPMTISKPSSAAISSTSLLGLQRRAFLEFLSDAGVPVSHQCIADVTDEWSLDPPMKENSLASLLASCNTVCPFLSAFSFLCHLPAQLRYFYFILSRLSPSF